MKILPANTEVIASSKPTVLTDAQKKTIKTKIKAFVTEEMEGKKVADYIEDWYISNENLHINTKDIMPLVQEVSLELNPAKELSEDLEALEDIKK